MQHFVIDDLPPADRKVVRKFYFRMGAGYAAALLLGFASIFLRTPPAEPDISVAPHAPRGVFSAVASEAPNRTRCAERDLRLITLLSEHGEAQDVPADDLRNAFFALVKARKACFAGNVDEATAIYDQVTFGGRAAQRPQ